MIEKRSTRNILRWKKSDRGSSHVRHGLDPRLVFYAAYHTKCVDSWLTNGKKTCPMCRQPVEKDGGEDGGPSTSFPVDVNETTPLLGGNAPSPNHPATDNSSSSELV